MAFFGCHPMSVVSRMPCILALITRASAISLHYSYFASVVLSSKSPFTISHIIHRTARQHIHMTPHAPQVTLLSTQIHNPSKCIDSRHKATPLDDSHILITTRLRFFCHSSSFIYTKQASHDNELYPPPPPLHAHTATLTKSALHPSHYIFFSWA